MQIQGKPHIKENIFARCYDQTKLNEWQRLWNAMVDEQLASGGFVTTERLRALGKRNMRLQIGDAFIVASKAEIKLVKEMALKHLVLPKGSLLPINKLKFYGPEKWRSEIENVIANVGFQAVGQILVGTYGSTGEITHAALGSGSTTPAASDTQLATEVYRNAMFSGTVSSNITYLTAVYNETETSGTYNEFGNFIDGTGTANSGILWSHVLTGGWVKTTSDVLVVDQKYTFTSS